MKKIMTLIGLLLALALLSACSNNNSVDVSGDETDISNSESITYESDSNNESEDMSALMSTGKISLEDVTSAYVEPNFKMVSSLSECYNYFETNLNDIVTTEKNSDGTVSLITVSDVNGNTKSTMKFSYTDKIVATATFFYDNGSTEKVAFSFYDENTLNIVAYVNSESEMSLYLYNKDGTFNSYVDGAGLSSLLLGSVMGGLGGAFSE